MTDPTDAAPGPEQVELPGFERAVPDPDQDREPTEISSIVADAPQAPGRVDAAEAVTGSRAMPGGEASAGGDPGQDSSLEDDR